MALPSELRLKKRSDFGSFRKPAAVFSARFLVLKAASREDDARKFAFAVSKRFGSAVKRNRLRRILSEWVRTHIDAFPAGFNWLVILTATPDSSSHLSEVLRESIEALAVRAKNELEP